MDRTELKQHQHLTASKVPKAKNQCEESREDEIDGGLLRLLNCQKK